MTRLLGMTLLMAGMASFVFAGAPVPEIDAPSASTAIALLSGGLLVLRGRRKK